MKKHTLWNLVYTILIILGYGSTANGMGPIVFSGSLSFPRTIKNVPPVRVYWSGHRIACETSKTNKAINFSIPGIRQQHSLYLVIAEGALPQTEDNVILYFYLPKGSPYKFYLLELNEQFDPQTKKFKLTWTSKENQLLTDAQGNLRLPDSAIIVYYDPQLIAGLEGGSGLDLPTIKVMPNVLSLVGGSEYSLHETSTRILCAAQLMDTVHRELDQVTCPSHDPKTIVTITT